MQIVKFQLGLLLLLSIGCSSSKLSEPIIYDTVSEVNYGEIENWASHPSKNDLGDAIPNSKDPAQYDDFPVDVFFIHPTTFTEKDELKHWNASLQDDALNTETDEQPIKYQASIFNQVGRLFAPRYRQAHLRSYFSRDTMHSRLAFERAYKDVEAAFLYYLEHENRGRPFVIASHSQGTTHAIPLIKQHVDGTAIEAQLVTAYLVGMPVTKKEFEHIMPCEGPTQTNCFNSWRTYRHGHTPTPIVGEHILSTNPVTWRLDGEYADKSLHKGAILKNFNKVYRQRVDAQATNGILWAHRPKFPFSFLLKTKNYHIADYNFYYLDVQENAKLRVKEYLQNTAP